MGKPDKGRSSRGYSNARDSGRMSNRFSGRGRGRRPSGGGSQRTRRNSKEDGRMVIEPHRHPGVFVGRGKSDFLATRNFVPGLSVYGERRFRVEVNDEQIEYRVWNPFRSKLGAAIMGGIDSIYMEPGSKVLYLGAASGTTVSHVSDIIGPNGFVYAVEFSNRSGRDLMSVAAKRGNVVPIIEDARHPLKYRMLVPMVDTIFADVAQPDQARIVAINAHLYLKTGGHFIISIKLYAEEGAVVLPGTTLRGLSVTTSIEY